MKHYPVFLSMADREVLFLGGGADLANKVRLLAKTPAQLTLISPIADPALETLITDGVLNHDARTPTDADIERAALVYISSENAVEEVALAARAKTLGKPVNVVDHTELCDFITPALVERDPLTIAISSDSKAPALSRHVKAKLDRILPQRLGSLGKLAESMRGQMKSLLPSPDARRRFLDSLFAGDFGEDVNAHAALLRAAAHDAPEGRIAIVGAGPGDSELLTLKAHRFLQQADVIVHDKLVSDEVLDLARRDAERIYVGKSRANHTMAQEDISQLLVTLARQGKFVVRLKGGDPFIFGRGGEELDVAEAAGVTVEVVPGISAALGCAADVGIPLTHRDHASAVSLVAGQRRDLHKQDWRGLAGEGRTLVIYMGLGASADIVEKLVSDGVRSDMPVAILENGTQADSRRINTTLAQMADTISEHAVKSPSLLIVGEVASEDRAALLDARIVPLMAAQG